MPEFKNLDYGNAVLKGQAIQGARSRNALAQNAVERIPQSNRAQDIGLQGAQQNLDVNAQQSAVEALVRGFGFIANSPDPKQAASAFIGSGQFQSAGQALGLPVEQFTVDETDDPEELRQTALGYVDALQRGSSALPAQTVAFNQMASGLSPADLQKAKRIALGLDSRAGQARVINVNGVPTLTFVGEGGQPVQIPLSSLQGEAGAAETLAGATQTGKEEATTAAIPERSYVEAEIEDYQAAPVRLRASQDIVQQVQQLDPVFDRVLKNAGVWTVGFGSTVKPAGSPAANMEADLNTLGANAAFDRLQQMRDSSPTGGALGQVSERELALLQSAVAAIAQSQSPEQFRENVLRLRENYKRIDALARQAQKVDRLKAQVNALRQRPETPATAGRIRNLQNQIYAIEDQIWQSMDETGVAAPDTSGGAQTSQVTATGPNGEKLALINGQWVPQ